MAGQPILPNSFEGRWVTLRGVSQEDYLTLYEWRSDLRSLHLWNLQRRIPPYEEYVAELERMLSQSIFFIVADRVSAVPIGFAQAYNMAGLEGYTYVLSYFVEAARHTSRPGETGLIFGDYLFGYFNLRKIYADVFQYNHDSMRIVEALGFREEGRQREHVFYIDRFWDMIRYSLTRERWNELRERFHRLLIIREEAEELLEGEAAALRR